MIESKYDHKVVGYIHEFIDANKTDGWSIVENPGIQSFARMKVKYMGWSSLSEYLRGRGVDVAARTLRHWYKGRSWDDPQQEAEFVDAIERMREVQKEKLLVGGLSKEYHSGMAQFILAEKFKMKSEDKGPQAITQIIVNKDGASVVEPTA